MTGELRQVGAKIMALDSVLAQYGPEANEARDHLRRSVANVITQVWPEESHALAVGKIEQRSAAPVEALQEKLRQLSPRNDSERWLQSRALQLGGDIVDARALLIQQVGASSLPRPFLVILIFWLTIIFASFGLFSPRNATVVIVLFVCAVSVAVSLFLIAELDHPYKGRIKISSTPLRTALAHMGQ